VVNVTAAVMVLLSNKTQKVPKDRSWKAAKVMMAKVRLLVVYTRVTPELPHRVKLTLVTPLKITVDLVEIMAVYDLVYDCLSGSGHSYQLQ